VLLKSAIAPVSHQGDVRKHSVIVDVVPVVTRLSGDNQLLEPLHTAATYLSWNHYSKWLSMIWSQGLPIHSMCKHDTMIRIHGPVELDGSAVETVGLLSVSIVSCPR
jgi:hypothetical protein